MKKHQEWNCKTWGAVNETTRWHAEKTPKEMFLHATCGQAIENFAVDLKSIQALKRRLVKVIEEKATKSY